MDQSVVWRFKVNAGLRSYSDLADQDFSAPSITPLKNGFWAKAKATIPGTTTITKLRRGLGHCQARLNQLPGREDPAIILANQLWYNSQRPADAMSDLHLVSRTAEGPPRADVIFVHGLGGDPFVTWQHDPENPSDSWPFWLAEDLPDVAIHCLEYEASASNWLGRSMPLIDRATNVLTVLETHGIGCRPIVFICHSLGGLLLKQLLRHAEDTAQSSWHAIADHTEAVIFLATPNAGSNLASWLDRLGAVLRASPSIEDLRPHDPLLRNLNLWYRENATTNIPRLYPTCQAAYRTGAGVK